MAEPERSPRTTTRRQPAHPTPADIDADCDGENDPSDDGASNTANARAR